MTPPDAFAGHALHFETERLTLRPFRESDFESAVPFYNDPDFLRAMEGDPPDAPITADYLKLAGRAMAKEGFLFAIVEKSTGRCIGEVCLQWMNLERGKIAGQQVMRLPLGLWDKTLWGQGYGTEVARCLLAHAFGTLRIDRCCAMDVRADNARAIRFWRSLRFTLARETDGDGTLDFEMTRPAYERLYPEPS